MPSDFKKSQIFPTWGQSDANCSQNLLHLFSRARAYIILSFQHCLSLILSNFSYSKQYWLFRVRQIQTRVSQKGKMYITFYIKEPKVNNWSLKSLFFYYSEIFWSSTGPHCHQCDNEIAAVGEISGGFIRLGNLIFTFIFSFYKNAGMPQSWTSSLPWHFSFYLLEKNCTSCKYKWTLHYDKCTLFLS